VSFVKTVTAALVASLSLPVFAGPDLWLIEKGRSALQAEAQRSGSDSKDAAGCPPDRLVLPLDHGPRAQTTPYLNERRKQRYEEQLRNCESARIPAAPGASGSAGGAG
jgi:hypothetical protein